MTLGNHRRHGGTAVALLGALLGLFVTLGAVPAPAARPASGIATAAAALRNGPVYVDPRASGELSSSQASALAAKIKEADKPVFVAVLPATAEFPPQTVLQDLRSAVGVTGVYAVRLGDRFNAGADPRVMPHNAVTNLAGQVRRSSAGSAATELNSFVDQAVRQAEGSAPDSWGSSGSGSGGGGMTTAVVLGVLVLLLGGGGYLVRRRARTARAKQEREQLEQLRLVVDEDITTFGEELDRLEFAPGDPGADDAMRGDYTRALDSYERAKARMAAARRPDDVRPVTEALEDGRFALATLVARCAGRPLPERRPPCFFDPRHGPSVRDVPWAPPGGATRDVPACAADATRVDDGDVPASRTVRTMSGPQPYWNAGPMYAPWAGGYFGGGLMPGLLIGTMMGSALTGPGYGGYGPDGGTGPDGGDQSGSDFDPGDFGGGFGDGGGGGGGFDGGGFQ